MRRALVAAGATALAVCGCSYNGAQSLPLPGGAATGRTYEVTVVFDDAGDLVRDEGVRVDDVPVGQVERIVVGPDLKAHVTVSIRRSVVLPANAEAILEETSLLGEKFVSLSPPTDVAPRGRLTDGAVLTTSQSAAYPDTEEVFGALSAILNGGDIGRLSTIMDELSDALDGHEQDVRGVIAHLTTLTSDLAAHTGDINAALTGLDHLSATLAAQHRVLGDALDQLPAGLRVLVAERPKITALLTQIGTLSQVATSVITTSTSDTVADLEALTPTVRGLAKNADVLTQGLEFGITLPFAKDAPSIFEGDYGGFFATVNADLDAALASAQASAPSAATSPTSRAATPRAASPTKSVTSSLPGLTSLVPAPLGAGASVLQNLLVAGTGAAP